MDALVWLAIPAAALVLALLWVTWASRTRPRADTHQTVEAHERFRAAFAVRASMPRRDVHGDLHEDLHHRDSA